jgi:hypothetical protein
LFMFAARERKDYKSKYESTFRKLEFARAFIMMSDKTKCDEYSLYKTNITIWARK